MRQLLWRSKQAALQKCPIDIDVMRTEAARFNSDVCQTLDSVEGVLAELSGKPHPEYFNSEICVVVEGEMPIAADLEAGAAALIGYIYGCGGKCTPEEGAAYLGSILATCGIVAADDRVVITDPFHQYKVGTVLYIVGPEG